MYESNVRIGERFFYNTSFIWNGDNVPNSYCGKFLVSRVDQKLI